ncbi:MAG: thioredoxin [Bacteroidales bacterium]|nr:thioredoxin [Bacteroidales bacterium]
MSILIWVLLGIFTLYLIYSTYRRYKLVKNYSPENESDKLVLLNDKNFSKQIDRGIVLVDFWAPWCGPCKMIAPVVSELAEQFEGKARIGKLNVDENKVTAAEYGVRSIPTLILFKDGEPVKQFVGVKPKSAFAKAIEAHLT